MDLSNEDLIRFNRQLLLQGFGKEAQVKLKNSKVLIVGCGGLGNPVALYLAASGVGNIGLIDFDTIEVSNLHRQILFDSTVLGKLKLIETKIKLEKIYPEIVIDCYPYKLENSNALKIFTDYDIIVDGSDNFQTRYLVNDACEILNKTLIYGAVNQFEGQVAVFNLNGSATYRDLFPSPPSPEMAPNCSEAGVIGPLVGIIGCFQALETIKVITGVGEVLTNKMILFEALNAEFRKLRFKRDINRPKVTKLIDYEDFCGSRRVNSYEINRKEFFELMKLHSDLTLIDVRSEIEHELENLGGVNYPMENIMSVPKEYLNTGQKVILYCATGARSSRVAKFLIEKEGFENIWSLNEDWSKW